MSNLFTQISDIAAQQRQQIEQATQSPSPVRQEVSLQVPVKSAQKAANLPKNSKPSSKVVPQSGATIPQSGTTISQLDREKLQTIIQELSQMPIGSNKLNVRMSEREMADIEEFIFGKLRREGLKGYDVSIAKLMRYSLRYLFRVHEAEFIAALKTALKTEEKLSI